MRNISIEATSALFKRHYDLCNEVLELLEKENEMTEKLEVGKKYISDEGVKFEVVEENETHYFYKFLDSPHIHPYLKSFAELDKYQEYKEEK